MILVFGASGSIGSEICKVLKEKEHQILEISSSSEKYKIVTLENLSELDFEPNSITGVVYAQGVNINNSLETINFENHQRIMDGNCNYILITLNKLLTNKCLAQGANICIISSIWETNTRKNKLSYTISKSCIGGIIRALVPELSEHQVCINAILPGVIDNEMSRATLSSEQIKKVSSATGFNRLVSLNDVTSLAYYLLIKNTGITGQSIKVDLGYTTMFTY